MKPIRKVIKLIVSLICISVLFSCASLKRIIPLKEINPEDLEPRVIFVDKKSIDVMPSQIKKTNP